LSLLIHDGELADACALMTGLGLEFTERRGGATSEDEAFPWDLVVSTPKRLLEFGVGSQDTPPTRVAILDKDSRTLRSMLQRAGINLIVRRPVHPAALRLLLHHALYRGPEKRRSRRVSVGAPVQYRVGLRRRSAILADLSVSGCRLLSEQPLPKGRDLRLSIPAEVTGDRGLSLRGAVLRTADSELPGLTENAITFQRGSRRITERLRSVVLAHARGPAVLPDGVTAALPSPAPVAIAPAPPATEQPTPPSEPERRAESRHAYSKHVVALGVEAARVLLGRDISLGGMRVDPSPEVSVGDELRIALHVRAREKPVVVRARVSRDDGEDGLVLQFRELSPSAERYLRRMVDFLPILAVRAEGEAGSGVIVSEILERRSVAAAG
jgi:hypothetical protein